MITWAEPTAEEAAKLNTPLQLYIQMEGQVSVVKAVLCGYQPACITDAVMEAALIKRLCSLSPLSH